MAEPITREQAWRERARYFDRSLDRPSTESIGRACERLASTEYRERADRTYGQAQLLSDKLVWKSVAD